MKYPLSLKAPLVVLALTLALASTAMAVDARGTIAGKVFDRVTGLAMPNVTVDAFSITEDRGLSVVTDPQGSYVVPDAPAGVYTFTLRAGGVDYPVRERLDVRVGMPFILESCFALDPAALAAAVREDCSSGLVEEARVASIGSLRFLVPPQTESETEPAGDVLDGPSNIEHDGIECLTREHYPLVDADVRPGEAIQTCRVYFRSDKYPDFYYVEMTGMNPTIDDFQAVLPKPTAETERIIYYGECVDNAFDSLQTPEFDPEVLETEECERRGAPAWFTGDPSIVVGATTPGANAIPPGFQAIGITGFVNSLGAISTVAGGAAGGSAIASTTGILVVSGAAAAATGAVIVTKDDDEIEASPPR